MSASGDALGLAIKSLLDSAVSAIPDTKNITNTDRENMWKAIANAINIGRVGIGSVIAHHPDISGAESVSDMRAKGFATMDGTTPASQGISGAIITGAMPDWNGDERFLRGCDPGSAGTEQLDAFQGHKHRQGGIIANSSSAYQVLTWGSYSPSPYPDYEYEPNTAEDDEVLPYTSPADYGDGTHGTPRTDSETRPINVSVVWMMRVK
ncbi:MAG: hypothetical protein ACFFC1_03695 [Promethearchaeota archaeon]